MTVLSGADIEQLRRFATRLRELLTPLHTLAKSMSQQSPAISATATFSADLFPGLSRARSHAWDEPAKHPSYMQMAAEIEAGLREMELLLQRGEYSDYLLERCELLGQQTASLLVALKRQQRQQQVNAPPLAALVGMDKTYMAMQRLQQQIEQQTRELQPLQRLREQCEQEVRWHKGASAARREELHLQLQAYTNQIEQITREIAYSRERLENIRRFIQQSKTP